jgi:hypothetical protein
MRTVFEFSVRCAVLSAALIACVPTLGSAQSPTTNVSLTYTFLRDAESDQSFVWGATIAATLRVRSWLAATAEIAVSTDSTDYSASGGGIYDFRYESIHAGPRVARATGRVRPYVELLAGATRWRIRERFLDRTGWQAATDFSLQPGVGVDVFFTRRAALRLGADLRVLFKHDNRFDTDYRTNLYRLHAGVSLHFGGRCSPSTRCRSEL